jgi:predicted ATPase
MVVHLKLNPYVPRGGSFMGQESLGKKKTPQYLKIFIYNFFEKFEITTILPIEASLKNLYQSDTKLKRKSSIGSVMGE